LFLWVKDRDFLPLTLLEGGCSMYHHDWFRFTKVVALTVLFFMGMVGTLKADEVKKTPYIIDEQHLLTEKAEVTLTRILQQTASSRNIHIRVLIINEAHSSPNFAEFAQFKVTEWESLNSTVSDQNTTYLVINVATKESCIILGKNSKMSPSLLQTVNDIQDRMIVRALEKDNVLGAVVEGSVALSTVLEPWTQDNFDLFASWQEFKNTQFVYWLKWLAQICVSWSIVFALRKLFVRPDVDSYQIIHGENHLLFEY
jgi:uncharacterized membrane protein YgcG